MLLMLRTSRRVIPLSIWGFCLIACDQGLIAGSQLDQPLLQVTGRVDNHGNDDVHVGVLWVDPMLEGKANWVGCPFAANLPTRLR